MTYGAFTGGHISQNPYKTNQEVRDEYIPGLIVKSLGETMTDPGNEMNAAGHMSDGLVYVDVTTEAKDPTVMGVMSSITEDDPDDPGGWAESIEGLVTINYNALGDGRVLVIDSNGEIENGDYICSSSVKGLGEKQDDDLLHNYTVAKATEPSRFDEITEVDPRFGRKVRMIACTYHCG
jgi:hypothetical protein